MILLQLKTLVIVKKLLQHYEISTKLIALHEHNEQTQYENILRLLKQGKSVAVISDAGTPLVSDPGYRMVNAAKNEGINVIPIPGACAAIAALSASGLPSDRFIFEGFLSAKSHARIERLNQLKNDTRTLVFYESPHRVLACLKDMGEVFGADRLCGYCARIN